MQHQIIENKFTESGQVTVQFQLYLCDLETVLLHDQKSLLQENDFFESSLHFAEKLEMLETS